MRNLALPCLAACLAACAAPSPERSNDADGGSPNRAATRLSDAAASPLNDLNLVREKIPTVLRDAQKGPYALPGRRDCKALEADVLALDAVLNADLDNPGTTADVSALERGAGFVGEAAVGAVRGAAQSVVPFRGWIRKLSGAERHSREVAAAIAAGNVRRAFLKGLGAAAGCQPPAAPRPVDARDDAPAVPD